jgi:hypothetical protein
MKRVCCYCERVYGHKCRSCGNSKAELIFFRPGNWLECLVCAHVWPPESDGVTHGICAECFEKHNPRAVADATGEP